MPDNTLRFYTTERLSDNRQITPEGFLVCIGTPIARTGMQLYQAGEVPIEPGGDGMIRVDRTPEEVFRPETIASGQGKPLVNEHPEINGEIIDVSPDNWRQFLVGAIINPRQGEGIYDDAILGDLVWYDPEVIELINSGRKREISLGYDASYHETGPGRAEQRGIIINHGALVEQGRCGPMCAVRDRIAPVVVKPVECGCRTRDAIKPITAIRRIRRVPRTIHVYF